VRTEQDDQVCFDRSVGFSGIGGVGAAAARHDACARDVARHCRKVMNDGDQAVLTCLKQNRSRISRGCEKVMVEHGQ